VITGMTTRNGWTRRLAALLLVLQGFAGGAVSLAHASERLSAPIHIEAQHSSSCVALHDELRCALCHYAGSQFQASPALTTAATAGAPERLGPNGDTPAPCRPRPRTAPPRAPPVPRS